MSKICSNCGTSVPDDSIFCTNCGNPISQQMNIQQCIPNNPPNNATNFMNGANSQSYGMNVSPYNNPNGINNRPYGSMMNQPTSVRNKSIRTINIVLIILAVIQIFIICFVRPGWIHSYSDTDKNTKISAQSVNLKEVFQ